MVITVRILTPERVVCSTTTDAVILKAPTGLVGVLEDHVSYLTLMDKGLLRIKVDNIWTPFIAGFGVAEIDRNQVTILVDSIEELSGRELSEVTKEAEKAALAYKEAEKGIPRM
jgi:F-type H+-transporting ATPase subunit epsilon